MKRRSFFARVIGALIAAPVVAKELPAPEPAPEILDDCWGDEDDYWSDEGGDPVEPAPFNPRPFCPDCEYRWEGINGRDGMLVARVEILERLCDKCSLELGFKRGISSAEEGVNIRQFWTEEPDVS